ncbi:MAG: hypothetical protein ABI972_28170 [Acidobacteriota bacterium]
MDEQLLREVAAEFLQPLISGSRLDPGHAVSKKGHACVAFKTPCQIEFKAEKTDLYRLTLRRSQPFEGDGAGAVSEKKVIEAFGDVLRTMADGLATAYRADILTAFPRRVVAKALSNDAAKQDTILAALDQLALWAGQQYEGKPITAAVGFDPQLNGGSVPFSQFAKEAFSSVLSNGFDTLLTSSFSGEVAGLETLAPPNQAPLFSPYRLGAICEWAQNGRIALVLNRIGEILVFQDSELRFARRSGRWHFLTHAPVITQMGGPDNHALRKAVYATCLDASFARTGACIGMVTSNHTKEWPNLAVSTDDHMDGTSTKAKALKVMVAGRKFQDLDRRLRQELVAIDGATLVDRTGALLAVGAILKIPGGSTGGGRLAAAKALGTLGVGIKVSQDGGIRGYHSDDSEPKFTVM